MSIPPEQVWNAHVQAKARMIATVRQRTGRALSPDVLAIGFARRAAAYKRADLIFADVERLRAIGRGRLQLVFAGKAHPRDEDGKRLIERIVAAGRTLGDDVPVVYVPDYDIDLAKDLVAGADVWLNTPLRPLEASGTSGMKAAHNGVPSLSVLDGWWLEGCIEGVTGWSIGSVQAPSDLGEIEGQDAMREDARDLLRKLQDTVLPMFYRSRERWTFMAEHAIALNASFFNTHRMVQQYVTNAYLA